MSEKIVLIGEEELEKRLKASLEKRSLPDCFLYVGQSGASGWLALDRSPGFGVATRLAKLLKFGFPNMAQSIYGTFDVVSIGVGEGLKERVVMRSLGWENVRDYIAVDVSSGLVDAALEAVSDMRLTARGVVAMLEDLEAVSRYWSEPALLCLLGNNLCNYEPGQVLSLFRASMGPEDLLLFDCCLINGFEEKEKREEAISEYLTPENVEFNLAPLLSRGVPSDALEFKLELREQETTEGVVLKTRKWIDVLQSCTVKTGEGEVRLTAGDVLTMGFTYKYTKEQVERMLSRWGFEMIDRYICPAGCNLLVLVRGKE